MQESRLVRHIEELSPKDRERFRLFVLSPFFNQHQPTSELLEVILECIHSANGNGSRLDKHKVYKRIFPKDPFDEQQLYNVMSYLKKLYHRFLSYQFFENQDFQEDLLTLEAAYENNQFDLLKNRGKQMEKTMTRHPHHNSDYYLANYRLNYLLAYYGGQYEDRSKPELFQRMFDHLDRFYIAEKLKNCCHLTANMMVMNTHYDFGFLEPLLDYLKQNWQAFESDATIVLYYTILMSLREENNPAHYTILKEILASGMNTLSVKEQGDLYAFANNYCIRRINLGDSTYQWELFHLYKQGLKTGLILDNGILSEWNYKNITSLGCSIKEFEWTENFIQEYKDKLPAHRRENAYNYNLAHLYYNKKMFSDVLSALLHVQFTDVKYHLNTTFLQLRTYYAMRDTEALLSLIETFRIYVIRNRKMTTNEKRGYSNFLRFAKKLALLKHNSSTFSKKSLKEKLDALSHKIETTENVINRYWLLEECGA
ncbi:MAG: hypothetical protein JNK77_07465 [Saprospiraceae bacterium]|nr:hypothetical protein [Saprospiraceae bacterium]